MNSNFEFFILVFFQRHTARTQKAHVTKADVTFTCSITTTSHRQTGAPDPAGPVAAGNAGFACAAEAEAEAAAGYACGIADD